MFIGLYDFNIIVFPLAKIPFITLISKPINNLATITFPYNHYS